jgi:hypothetical protein
MPDSVSPGTSFLDLAGITAEPYILDLARIGVFNDPADVAEMAEAAGKFRPEAPITRAEFVRWLVRANNAIFADNPNLQYHPADPGTAPSFRDVLPTYRDFAYIQALASAGVVLVSGDPGLFRPEDLLTREELLAIKESVDRGAFDELVTDSRDPAQLAAFRLYLPWKDADQITPAYRPAIATEYSDEQHAHASKLFADRAPDNIGRAFGAVSLLRPIQPVTRAQAASALWKIGAHANPFDDNVMLARTADRLLPRP